MKSTIIYDIVFIILSAVILTGLVQLGYEDALGKFAFLVALIAYFAGKHIKGREIKNKN